MYGASEPPGGVPVVGDGRLPVLVPAGKSWYDDEGDGRDPVCHRDDPTAPWMDGWWTSPDGVGPS